MTKNKVVMVTGGSLRIGKQICLDLADNGYDIIIHYRNSKKEAQSLKDTILSKGVRCETIRCDLSNYKQVNNLMAKAQKIFGSLYALINNASVFENDYASSFTKKQWEKHMSTNLYAPLKLSQDFYHLASKKIENHIINILDQSVQNPDINFFSYSISKLGLHGATKILAKEFSPRTRVNSVAPGPTLKNIHQSDKHFNLKKKKTLLRIGSPPVEISGTVKFILQSKSLTGQLIIVDGGEHLS